MSFINELGKPHKKRTINFIQLWDEILSSYIKKKDSDFGEHRTKNMYVDMIGLYSQEDNVTFVYTIDGFPTKEIPNDNLRFIPPLNSFTKNFLTFTSFKFSNVVSTFWSIESNLTFFNFE